MKPLFTEAELNSAKSNDLLPIECLVCGKTFYKTKHYIKSNILNPKRPATGNSCSKNCANIKQKANKTIKKICPKCGKEFETTNGYKEKQFCSITCSRSRKLSIEEKENRSESAKKSQKVQTACIKNLKKYQESRNKNIIKVCPVCKKEFIVPYCCQHRIYCSRGCYNNDKSLKFRKKNKGGYREGSGRSKSGWYKGYYCGSSYELAWVIYNIDHQIKFERNLKGFDYKFEENAYKYYPDFIIGTIYYEIKGFKRKADDAKFKYFPHTLNVLFKKELKEIFEYVESMYGKNFIELYEGNPYNERTNVCLICGKPAKNLYCCQKCSGIAASKRKKSSALGIRTPD